MNFTRFCNGEAVATAAAEAVAVECRRAVAARGCFHWVLAGGSSPQRCYQLLRSVDLPWDRVHCWFGDERLLPTGDSERNETAARAALLDHVPIPAAQIHAITGDDPVVAANAYSAAMAMVDCFDLVLLGMGEDGHTASLFPDNPALTLGELAVPVFHSPKPPPLRVSMSFTALNNHRRCLLLVTGAGKRTPFARIQHGESLPAGMVQHVEWLVDSSASPEA
ncbi:MAG: 6-phosphogluconolactonase [Mariprofundales bacterium]|nr:6-phosphogluconolactonase [Mariprofundales bacterium]